jgi:DNA-binding IclR family transcriptional regulator
MPLAATRALEVLSKLAFASEPMTAAEINAATGLGRASGYRLLETLVNEGWVRIEGDPRKYEPTLRLWELGAALLSRIRGREVALPYVIELALETNLPADISFFEDNEIVYTDRINVLGDRVLPVLFYRRPPGVTSSSGKAIFAHRPDADTEAVFARGLPKLTPYTKDEPTIRAELKAVREQGYAVADREYHPNRSAIAVPLLDREGLAIGAVSLGTDGELTQAFVDRVRPVILRYGQLISAQLGYRGSVSASVS